MEVTTGYSMSASVEANQPEYIENDGVRFCKPTKRDSEKKPRKRDSEFAGKVLYYVYDTATRNKFDEKEEYFIRAWTMDESTQFGDYILTDVYGREFYSTKYITRVINNLPKITNVQLHIKTEPRRVFTGKTGELVDYVKANVVVEEIPDKKDN